MIEEIRIKDFAIIDSLTVPLKEGLNVLTGETGAGKSIIVDAVSVLLKEKVSSSDFIKHGKSEANIEVVIFNKNSETEDDLIIFKRILNIQGKNRAYVNDFAYTAQSFVKFVTQKINIHGQHEHTYLLKKENHIDFFDTISGLTEEVSQIKELYERVIDLRNQIEKLREEAELNRRKIELYQFQLSEIKAAELKEQEDRSLNERREILKNIVKLKELAESSYGILYEDKSSVYSDLSKIRINLESILKFDSNAEEIKKFIDNAISQVEEAVFLLRKLKEAYEPDPFELEKIEDRLALIDRLKNKYGKTVEEILDYARHIETQLSSYCFSEEELKVKEAQLNQLSDRLKEFAEKVSEKRIEKAKTIEKEIIKELEFLGFSKPKFEISIKRCPLYLYGIDDIEFYFSANPGEPTRPLNKVASGGELSRLMLALKCVELKLASSSAQSMTLIFDEIDAGIGGKVADNVARRLKELSKHHQVLCITHLPQIAALADNHLKIEKFHSENKTSIKIEVLNGEQRKEEIARMLSGRITETSLFHAEELLENK